jgi:hypothetical protein
MGETEIGIGQMSAWKINVITPQTATGVYFEVFNKELYLSLTSVVPGSGRILGYSKGPCKYTIPLMAYRGILPNRSRPVCTLEPTVHTAPYLRAHSSYCSVPQSPLFIFL